MHLSPVDTRRIFKGSFCSEFHGYMIDWPIGTIKRRYRGSGGLIGSVKLAIRHGLR